MCVNHERPLAHGRTAVPSVHPHLSYVRSIEYEESLLPNTLHFFFSSSLDNGEEGVEPWEGGEGRS